MVSYLERVLEVKVGVFTEVVVEMPAPGISKKFCTWNRWLARTNLASILAAVPTVTDFLRRSSELWCFRKSTPFTLKGHNLSSRIFETSQIETLRITSASSALAVPRGKGKQEKHAAIIHISICVWVCLSACFYIIQCCHWTWNYENDFVWSWCVSISNGFPIVYLSCPWMAEVLHHLGIWSFIAFILCISL